MTEIEEAIEHFESGNPQRLGLYSTFILGQVLAVAYCESQARIKELEAERIELKGRTILQTTADYRKLKAEAEKRIAVLEECLRKKDEILEWMLSPASDWDNAETGVGYRFREHARKALDLKPEPVSEKEKL